MRNPLTTRLIILTWGGMAVSAWLFIQAAADPSFADSRALSMVVAVAIFAASVAARRWLRSTRAPKTTPTPPETPPRTRGRWS